MSDQIDIYQDVVPGTSITISDFADDFCDHMTTDEEGNPSAAEADAWAKEQLGGEPTDEVKALVTPAILAELQRRDSAEKASEASEDSVEAPVSDSESDQAEEGTTPADTTENASEGNTEASEGNEDK